MLNMKGVDNYYIKYMSGMEERKEPYNNRGYNNKHRDGKKQEARYVKKTPKIVPSKEAGFTGPTENWFNGKQSILSKHIV